MGEREEAGQLKALRRATHSGNHGKCRRDGCERHRLQTALGQPVDHTSNETNPPTCMVLPSTSRNRRFARLARNPIRLCDTIVIVEISSR